ncbi:hypothetical protein MANES_15G166600v8 [Manihot esculenta]|nr:hypothetical protein MANES_15G166600v8 [Manihot esculenta]
MLMTAPFAGPVGRGFAVKHEISRGVTAYGMASCWKILDKDLCYTCLSNAASSALSCLPSTEARVLNTGCFLRYADFSFANESTSEIREKIFSFITFVICVVTICLSAIGIGVCVGKHTYKRKNSKKKLKGMDDLLLDEGLPFLQFKYETIKKATENFEEVRRLGEGGFGEVYKGALGDGREIAIKRLYASKESQIREICNEVDIISRAQHKNVVRLLGCCFTSADSFLVYEYMANRSLDLMLFDPAKKNELTWKKRLLIITGTAEGLEYLHTDCQVRIIHRDIKASNILLDLKHKPKISDFGLARFYSCDHSLFNTAVAGTLGYMAPEYIAKGRLTEKFDVYSFGILVIEIVTGIENNKHQSEDAYETLIAHVWRCFQSNTISEIVDKNMEIEDMNEIERVIQIGLLCTQESPNSRPTMTKVVQMLREKDLELPQPSMPPFIDEHMELHCLGSEGYQQRRSFSDYLSN